MLIFILDKFVRIFPEKLHILKKLNITNNKIDCLNAVISNYQIYKLVITPHILSEFLNKIKTNLKEDYKQIKKECLEDLKSIGELQIHKNAILAHNSFLDFGNDISLLLATEKQITELNYSCILSFDGRFIEKFFRKRNNILAFKLDTLEHFY